MTSRLDEIRERWKQCSYGVQSHEDIEWLLPRLSSVQGELETERQRRHEMNERCGQLMAELERARLDLTEAMQDYDAELKRMED